MPIIILIVIVGGLWLALSGQPTPKDGLAVALDNYKSERGVNDTSDCIKSSAIRNEYEMRGDVENFKSWTTIAKIDCRKATETR